MLLESPRVRERGVSKMTKGFVYQEIGIRIRDLRGNARQKDWATRIGCDQGYISQVENGVTKPSLSFLKGVATITGASIDWILTGGRGGQSKVREAVEAAGLMDCRDVNCDAALDELARSPRLLAGVGRLLGKGETGRTILETLSDMDEDKLSGLVAFIGSVKK